MARTRAAHIQRGVQVTSNSIEVAARGRKPSQSVSAIQYMYARARKFNVPGASRAKSRIKVRPAKLGLIDVGKLAGVEASGARSGVSGRIGELGGPHAVLAAGYCHDRLAVVAEPFSERILAAGAGSLELTPRSAGRIQPVRA